MEYFHIQQLTDGFNPQDTLDFKYDSLMDIVEHFCIDDRLDMKRSLEDILRDRLENLISEYESRVIRLKSTLSSIRSSSY